MVFGNSKHDNDTDEISLTPNRPQILFSQFTVSVPNLMKCVRTCMGFIVSV